MNRRYRLLDMEGCNSRVLDSDVESREVCEGCTEKTRSNEDKSLDNVLYAPDKFETFNEGSAPFNNLQVSLSSHASNNKPGNLSHELHP
jgi:hypothetical protein